MPYLRAISYSDCRFLRDLLGLVHGTAFEADWISISTYPCIPLKADTAWSDNAGFECQSATSRIRTTPAMMGILRLYLAACMLGELEVDNDNRVRCATTLNTEHQREGQAIIYVRT